MPRRNSETGSTEWPSLKGLDRLLEHRIRLGVCVLLSRNDALSFSRLKEFLKETDGSLGAHLRKLEEAGYLSLRREFLDRKPVTWYALTRAGRASLKSHLAALHEVIQSGPSAG
jgi:DNA-binding MarR family transcriptional regulator